MVSALTIKTGKISEARFKNIGRRRFVKEGSLSTTYYQVRLQDTTRYRVRGLTPPLPK